MQFAGERREVTLATNDRQAASRSAAKFYAVLRAKGWKHALDEVLPEAKPKPQLAGPTVGDWIVAAGKVFQGNPRTFTGYATSFRRIVADLEGIKDPDGQRFDYRAGGREQWLESVGRVGLASVTPDRVDLWRKRFVSSHGTTPLKVQRARRNANSFIRQARALFSRGILKRIGMEPPHPLPFAGVDLEPEGSTRYVGTFDACELMTAAREQLKSNDQEAWKAFLLLLCAGLRRGELDALCWSQIDATSASPSVRVMTNDFFSPKTQTSERMVPLAASIAAELEGFRPGASGVFVIESRHAPPPREARDRRYRCRDVFDRLVAWLRTNRIVADKPLHELRKEFGSIITAQADLFTASRMLGHSTMDVTQRFYAEQRVRVVVDPMAKSM